MIKQKKYLEKVLLLTMMATLLNSGCRRDETLALESEVHISPSILETDQVGHIRRRLRESSGKDVLVVAHRGDWRNAPENSLQAIRNSIAMGVDIVEVDVKKTKDGHLVLMHDKTLDRTTTGSGYVSDWTLDSLKMLWLKNGTGRPTKYKVPTLEDAMNAAKGNIMVNLDHCYDYFTEAFTVLEKTKTTDHVIIKGYKKTVDQVNEELGPYLNEVTFMPIINLDTHNARSVIRDYQLLMEPQAMELVFQMDTSAVIEQFELLKAKGSRVWVNSLWGKLNAGHEDDLAISDPESSYGWIVGKGANMIQTDRPSLLLKYLRAKGLHD
ncbi:MAG: glycerophosphodiester phosphodiesterase family protein [Reichenbachiella sp.]|uniref:glycerophosphodiester phosphodiesterase family protein n=1 Tax=Reichenbachiella sp. TaxID=2184521 RepID=UPI003266506A